MCTCRMDLIQQFFSCVLIGDGDDSLFGSCARCPVFTQADCMHATVSEYTEALRTAWLCAVVRISFVAAGQDDGFGVFVKAHGSFVNSFVLVCFRVGDVCCFVLLSSGSTCLCKRFVHFAKPDVQVVFHLLVRFFSRPPLLQ